MKRNKFVIILMSAICFLALASFIAQPMMSAFGKDKKKKTDSDNKRTTLIFNADSAFMFCQKQCDFGPRIMNSTAHDKCAEWIAAAFEQYGCTVSMQRADLKGYDGTVLKSCNITASLNPEAERRIMFCAHWDSRPWADNDPDPANHHTPVMAANDAASGVAVMLELARVMTLYADSANQQMALKSDLGIDFVCFDAEDWGTPQWADNDGETSDTWALGAQYWANNFNGTKPVFGILLDMVGGQGSKFYEEQYSRYMASSFVDLVWKAARTAGMGEFFPRKEGGAITDDHVPVNRDAQIPCIDVIPYYPDCAASSFGPTWHTVQDDMQHIDPQVLKAVGQTMLQVIYEMQ